jgi:acetyltransferase-like isoleucine patch superfamily enzyme
MLRKTAKTLLYSIGLVLTAPLWLPERTARRLFGRDVWLAAQSQILSLLPGTGGVLLRNAYYRMVLASCPFHVCFQFGSLPSYSDIHIGKEVYIGLHCKLGLVDIGDGSILSDDAHVLSGARQHSADGFSQEFHRQRVHRDRISIGRNCWIGAHAVVMANIGDNCIIGAGAVVTTPIPANSVAVGIPARVVRNMATPAWTEDGHELACAGMETKS